MPEKAAAALPIRRMRLQRPAGAGPGVGAL